jgi:hypothetical protein
MIANCFRLGGRAIFMADCPPIHDQIDNGRNVPIGDVWVSASVLS